LRQALLLRLLREVKLACPCAKRHRLRVQAKSKPKGANDLAARIYRRLVGMRGVDEAELWQHALFFAMSPQERCHFSLKTARSALSLRRSARKK
jgi:hypothetical protein